MDGAQLIYDALERAKNHLERRRDECPLGSPAYREICGHIFTLQLLSQEISNGLASRGGPRGPIA